MTVEVDVVVGAPDWSEQALESLAVRAVGATLAHLGLAGGDVAILACDDARIAELNAGFRGRAAPTNVLSWPAQERGASAEGAAPVLPEAGEELGDIAIAYGTCAAEAREAAIPFDDHVAHLLVHATLHLLGYDHVRDGDAVLMERIEVEILGKLGLPDPYIR